MHVTEDVIQQLVVETVASQEDEALGVVVIVIGRDSLSVGRIGSAPNPEDVSQAMASFDQQEMASALIH